MQHRPTPTTIPAAEVEAGDIIRRTGSLRTRLSDLTVSAVTTVTLEGGARMTTIEGETVDYYTPRLLAYGADEKVTVLR